MIDKIKELAREFNPQAVDFCQRLIRVPSLSGEEKDVADLYMAEMEKLGYDQVFRDDWGNVIGIIKGDLPGPNIMYNGHLDHVDVGELEQWMGYDPYGGAIDSAMVYNQDMTAEEEAQVIHGRAAADVKGGGAGQVYAGKVLMEMRQRFGYKMKGDFILTMVVLEEPAEMLGMIKLLEETFPARNLKAHACVSCEATSLKLYLGHRGRAELQVTLHGVTSHGSAPWLGVNAVNKATRFIDEMEKIVAAEKKGDPEVGDSSIALTIINCSPGSMCIVPDVCNITYDRRFPPQETPEDCIDQVERVIRKLSAEDKDFKATVGIGAVERVTYTGKRITLPNQKEAYKLEKDHPVTKGCAQALEKLGQEVKYGYWNFGTDLPVSHVRHKIPSIGYSGMQEYYCHRPVDMVRIDYMEKALAGYVAIYLELSALDEKDFAV